MIKNHLKCLVLAGLLLCACQQPTTGEKQSGNSTQLSDSTAHNIIQKTLRNEAGVPMDMTFDNTDNTATVEFRGAVIKLKQQPAGSGIWYTNDEYELRGKGNDMTLSKDGEVIFRTGEDEL